MLKLSTSTKLAPKTVLDRATEFFGPGGYGLEQTERDEMNVGFEGGGGGVRITAYKEDSKTTVDMETREWESQVKEFTRRIKK